MKRLLLVGGGHAHLAVLAALARRPPTRRCEVVLVSPADRHHYSGMVPGFLRGAWPADALAVDLGALARAAGARLVIASARRVDGHERVVDTTAGPLAFDLASLDVGAHAGGLDAVPGARAHAHAARPIARILALDAALAAAPPGSAACVVGGGAAGVEVALALRTRLGGPVTLVERAPTLLPGDPAAARLAGRLLARRGVAVRTGADVVAVDAAGATLAGGARVDAPLVVWLAGAAPPPLLAASALPRDAAGWLLVDATLRAVDGSPVWGAGDCVTLRDHPDTPKAGVYAVRAGPVLAHNLRAALDGGTPRRFHPRRAVLSLLDTADGRALLRWHGVAVHGRWAWWLKRGIDGRFVASYRRPG